MPIIERSVSKDGLVTELGFEDGKMHVRYTQDASALYTQNQKLRESDDYWKTGIRKSFMHAVSLSNADCLKMKIEDGIDPYTCSADELNKHVFRNREKWGHCIVTKARRV
jgi:hypothetical protein